MTSSQIRTYVLTYLEATECQIMEQSDCHVTVKLSPEADRELTGRPYYWAFVERVQIEPETMSFTFIFDQDAYEILEQQRKAKEKLENPDKPDDLLLNRYFGAVRPLPVIGPGRIQQDYLHYGSPRLKQIFAAAQRKGSCVYVFEDPGHRQRDTLFSAAYEPWLGACFKTEFACDMKRQELHFYGISLSTGTISTDFGDRLSKVQLLPRLPENVHITPARFSLERARELLENQMKSYLNQLDPSWAAEARSRKQEELLILEGYYQALSEETDEAKKQAAEEQYRVRQEEIRWQYEPRITVSVINSGIFHLRTDRLPIR
ncbi:YqhG family protein [Paenibacillus sp. CAA11]|uniref:YqhG family protein n=1 Tax=Paenibacillus sp. CAA11 TaxID=1532905 RepID=UPI002D7657C7|nr:YqhG family protein [Paenibacillus sp. CAA11]